MKSQDLSGLTDLDLLDLAIQAEAEASDRYGEFADQMQLHHNPEAAEFFRRMQAQELEHLAQLQLQRTPTLPPREPFQPLRFFDSIEALAYETAHYKMTPTHVLEAALRAELRASVFYNHLKTTLTDPKARELAHSLWREEQAHMREIKLALHHLPTFPNNWEEDDDEPAPQD
ncbi:ferritin-like domain-containing protein [Nitrospira sp. T9]|uniref:ferritin-like domain-containing protein n=1 Tax=unclassified Nitrospira TaxID=2652172 RepID=UPI003F95C422